MIRSIRLDVSALLICAGVLSAAMLVGGCSASKISRAERASMVQSRTLTAHLGLVVDEAVRHAAKTGRVSSADLEDPAFVESVRRSILAQYGEALYVLPDTEDAFARGRFDSSDNAEAIDTIRAQLAESFVPLNTVEVYLLDRHSRDELSPPELELTRRLLKAHFDAVLIGEILSAF